MSSPQSASTPQGGESAGAANGSGVDDKPRLTEREKKQNHIASGESTEEAATAARAIHLLTPTPTSPLEQKRRQAIREGFDRMTELVPGLEGQGRSEGLVLQRTVEFMKKAIEERQRLIREIESRGGTVDDKDRL